MKASEIVRVLALASVSLNLCKVPMKSSRFGWSPCSSVRLALWCARPLAGPFPTGLGKRLMRVRPKSKLIVVVEIA